MTEECSPVKYIVTIPGIAHAPDHVLKPDITKLADRLEKVEYVEVWSGRN